MTEQSGNTPSPKKRVVDNVIFQARVRELVAECGGDPSTYEGDLITDLLLTSLKLVTDGRTRGELKLLRASFKEMRYAYNVFEPYRETPKITIFGSARTKPEHPDYIAAVNFSREMGNRGWLSITGAGDGIMVIFNDPLPCDAPATDALRMALAMRERMSSLCESWRDRKSVV